MSGDLSGFYLCPDYAGQGLRVLLLAEAKWTRFLRERAGLPESPFFTRPRRTGEPQTHPNGHPWGWVYLPSEALLDEVRWLTAEGFQQFKCALESAVSSHAIKVK